MPRRYATAEGFVTIGRFFLIRGADARKVLDQFYDVVTKQQPDFVEAYYATAELALDKEDYAARGRDAAQGAQDASQDPRFHYLLARCSRRRRSRWLGQGAGRSPQDQPAPWRQPAAPGRPVDRWRAIPRSRADARSRCSTSIPSRREPGPTGRCWRICAATRRAKRPRAATALARWRPNPEVDHLIGRKLSQKYRFAEGSALQKQALGLDPDYLPAKVQLCQDLLRLGDETEGWKLAAEIFSKDGYNVVAYNLVTLRDRLAGFRTLEEMASSFAWTSARPTSTARGCWQLLRRARKTLCEKYGVTSDRAGHRRDFSAAQGIRGANVRAAGGRRSAGRLLRPRGHGQQPGLAGRASRRTGRPSCGMSFAMSSPSPRRATRCLDG